MRQDPSVNLKEKKGKVCHDCSVAVTCLGFLPLCIVWFLASLAPCDDCVDFCAIAIIVVHHSLNHMSPWIDVDTDLQ